MPLPLREQPAFATVPAHKAIGGGRQNDDRPRLCNKRQAQDQARIASIAAETRSIGAMPSTRETMPRAS